MRKYNYLNKNNAKKPEFTGDIDKAFAVDFNKQYGDKFYDLSDDEITAKVCEIQEWYRSAEDTFNQYLNEPFIIDDNEKEPVCGPLMLPEGEEHGDPLNLIIEEMQKYMPLATFLTRNGKMYDRFVKAGKQICKLVKKQDYEATFHVGTIGLLGTDLELEIKSIGFGFGDIDDYKTFLELSKKASSWDIRACVDDSFIMTFAFKDAFTVTGVIENR